MRRPQAPFDPSVDSLCHPWFTTTNLSYRFPIYETSATALCGTTGKHIYMRIYTHTHIYIYYIPLFHVLRFWFHGWPWTSRSLNVWFRRVVFTQLTAARGSKWPLSPPKMSERSQLSWHHPLWTLLQPLKPGQGKIIWSRHGPTIGFKPSSRPLLWREADHPSPNSGGGWELSLNLKYLEMKNAIWYHLISSNLGASARSFPQFPHEMVLFKFEGIGENRRTCTVLLGPLQSTMQGELMPAVSQCDSALNCLELCVVPCFWSLDLTIGYTLIYPYHTPEWNTYVLSTVAGGHRRVPNEAHLGVWYKLVWRGITKYYKHVFMVFNTRKYHKSV